MHTVTGATSIAGLKKWAAQQPAPGADGAASAQYVAVASDACNIEFDFLGRAAGSHVPRGRSSTGSGGAGHLRLEAPLRWPEAEPGLRGQREPWPVLGGVWVGGRVRSPAAVVLCSLAGAAPNAPTSLRLCA